MNKLTATLLAAALLTALCACGASPEPQKAPEQSPDAAAQPGVSVPFEPAPVTAPETDEPEAPETQEKEASPDGLNEFGRPDLSGFTADELWDMYLHPENWDPDVLSLADEDYFDKAEDDEPFTEPELGIEYGFDLGEWHDYDPGDWRPGPDEIPEPEGEPGFEPREEPEAEGLPEEYAFLIPEGLKEGDRIFEDGGSTFISLVSRDGDLFGEVVERVRSAGFTESASEVDMFGIKMYEAENGSEKATVMQRPDGVLVSFEKLGGQEG